METVKCVRACARFLCVRVTARWVTKGETGKSECLRGDGRHGVGIYVFVRLGSPSVVWVFDEVLG